MRFEPIEQFARFPSVICLEFFREFSGHAHLCLRNDLREDFQIGNDAVRDFKKMPVSPLSRASDMALRRLPDF